MMKVEKKFLIFLRVTSISLIFITDLSKNWTKSSIYLAFLFLEAIEIFCSYISRKEKRSLIKIIPIIIQALIFELSIHYSLFVSNFIGNLYVEWLLFIECQNNTLGQIQKALYILPIFFVVRVFVLLLMTQNYVLLIQIFIFILPFCYELIQPIFQKGSAQVKLKETAQVNEVQVQAIPQSPLHIYGDSEKEDLYMNDKISNQKIKQSDNIQRIENINSPNNIIRDRNSKSIYQSQISSLSIGFFQQVLNILPYGCIVLSAQCELSKMFEMKNEDDILKEISKLIKGSKISQKKSTFQSGENIPCNLKLNSYNTDGINYLSQKHIDDWKKVDSGIESLLERSRQHSIYQQSNVDASSPHQRMNSFVRLSYKIKDDFDEIKYFKIKIYNSVQGSSQNYQQNNLLTLILIKNVSKKKELCKIKKQHQFQNQLLESFSHELRTPLNCSIQSIQAVIQFGISRHSETLLNSALGSNYLLLHQINDILDTAAFQNQNFTYKWSYFYISEIINEINTIYMECLQLKNITFKINLSKQDFYSKIKSDKSRIMQILVNLMNNSIKFTKQGGTINLNIDIVQLPDSPQSVKFELKDNGIGIDIQKLENIKTNLSIDCSPSLKKTEINEQFTGLGLTICSKLAQGLSKWPDTNLQLQSNPIYGTLVYFFVDDQSIQSNNISYKTPEHISQKSSKIFEDQKKIQVLDQFNLIKDYDTKIKVPEIQLCFDRVNIQKEKINSRINKYFPPSFEKVCKKCTQILVVDDIPFNHLALKAMLSVCNLECDSAYDGIQAIQMVQNRLQEHCESYRLIFMDIEMPKMNGFQTTNKIKSILGTNYNYNIIMCSAYDSAENVEKAYEYGMSGYLFKPVKAENLKLVLQKYKCYKQSRNSNFVCKSDL